MIKLVIFDLDGPILDSFGVAKNSVFKTGKKLKLTLPGKEGFILSWGYPGKLVVKKLFPEISDKKAKTFIKIWAENEKQKKIPLVKGARESLEKIRKMGLATAVLTTRCHNLEFHFGRLKLSEYFDFFQSLDNPNIVKERVHPDHIFHAAQKDGPEFFDNLAQWAAQRNISPKESVFIDDTLTGLKLTRKMGIPFLGVCTGPLSSKKDWKRYGNLDKKYVIHTIAELPAWLKNAPTR